LRVQQLRVQQLRLQQLRLQQLRDLLVHAEMRLCFGVRDVLLRDSLWLDVLLRRRASDLQPAAGAVHLDDHRATGWHLLTAGTDGPFPGGAPAFS
jgi:hypothetical protein